MDGAENSELVELTAEIISAYVSNNDVRPGELPTLIAEVHSALVRAPQGPAQPEPQPQTPAVSVRRSVTPDYIFCLEDGKGFKSLRRHLQSEHGMTPDEYRALLAGNSFAVVAHRAEDPECGGHTLWLARRSA